MKKYFSIYFCVLATILLTGCAGMFNKAKASERSDPNGNCTEQIQYHKNEIEKYELAVKEEEDKNRKALSTHHMSEARQASNRMSQYKQKIRKHQMEIDKLESEGICSKSDKKGCGCSK